MQRALLRFTCTFFLIVCFCLPFWNYIYTGVIVKISYAYSLLDLKDKTRLFYPCRLFAHSRCICNFTPRDHDFSMLSSLFTGVIVTFEFSLAWVLLRITRITVKFPANNTQVNVRSKLRNVFLWFLR